MASPCLIRITQCAAADVPTPASGKVNIFLDSGTSQPSYKDSAGAVNVFGSGIPVTIMDALGDLIYGSAADTAAKLAGNTTATKKFLRQTGTGAVSAAPAWDTIAASDVPSPGLTDDGNTGASITIDFSGGKLIHKATLTANCTFTFTAPPTGSVIVLRLSQDATGSRTVTWPAAVHWPGGTTPTLTTTASKVDVFTFLYDGTTYFGVSSGLNYTA